jgi:hypothetical protein
LASTGAASTRLVVGALNANPLLSDFVVLASNSVRVKTGSNISISGGDLGASGSGSGSFLSPGFVVDLQTGSTIHATRNLIADSVRLGTGVSVGDVQTNNLTVGTGASHGAVSPMVPLPSLPTPATVTVGTNNLTVATGATVTATPGQYANINVGTGGTLRLSAGLYQVSSVTVGTGGKVEALDTVEVRIANRWSSSSGTIVRPAAGTTLTARDIRIEVSGINGTTGNLNAVPKAAAFGTGSQVRALVLVPNGTFMADTNFTGTGAFLGRDIDISTGSTLTFQDGFIGCSAASCNDNNPCTVDTCNSDGSCGHAAAADGTTCSDGNACTQADACQSGACVGASPVICFASDQCHDAGVCDATTGVCSNPQKADGTNCSDGNACTQSDACQLGVCTGTDPVTCSASDQCHDVGSCDPTTGTCSNPPQVDGTTCTDGNACTQTDTCQSGACVGASPVICTASDQCHAVGVCVSVRRVA